MGTKGPTVSSNIALKGKYLSLYPFQLNKKNTHTSNNNKEYLHALKHLLNPVKFSLVIKKEAITANINFLLLELNNLKNNWIQVIKKSKQSNLPGSIDKKNTFILSVLKKYRDIKFESVHVDSYKESLMIRKILTKLIDYQSNLKHKIKIEYHKTGISLIKHFSLDLIISYSTKPRVNLYTGGYIVIEKTEALTSIDINSGSFKSLPNSGQTSLWINYLAIHEIARQIKLRNIGGIIVIDFIDSSDQSDQMKLLTYIDNLLKKDQTKCNIVQISELGILELTRTRYGQSIYDAFTYKCKVCDGLGYTTTNLNLNRLHYQSLLLDFYPVFLKNQLYSA